jgi:hypothetical protein
MVGDREKRDFSELMKEVRGRPHRAQAKGDSKGQAKINLANPGAQEIIIRDLLGSFSEQTGATFD